MIIKYPQFGVVRALKDNACVDRARDSDLIASHDMAFAFHYTIVVRIPMFTTQENIPSVRDYTIVRHGGNVAQVVALIKR